MSPKEIYRQIVTWANKLEFEGICHIHEEYSTSLYLSWIATDLEDVTAIYELIQFIKEKAVNMYWNEENNETMQMYEFYELDENGDKIEFFDVGIFGIWFKLE